MNTYRAWIWWTFALVMLIGASSALIWKHAFINRVYTKDHLVLAPATSTLIVGASHAQGGIDPAALDNAVNAAVAGEPLFLTYYKLRALLMANPQISTVVVPFGPIHVAEWQDVGLFGGDAQSRELYMNYFPICDRSCRSVLSRWSADNVLATLKFDFGVPLGFVADLRIAAKGLRGTLLPDDLPFFGGYQPMIGTHLEAARVETTIRKYFYRGGAVARVSVLSLQHIEMLVDLARAHGIRLLIVNTPMTATFRERIPGLFQNEYAAAISRLRERDPQLLYLDCSRIDLGDEMYLDPDHLNRNGARLLSAIIAQSLRGSSTLGCAV